MLYLLTLAKPSRSYRNAFLALVLVAQGTALVFAQEGPSSHAQWRRTSAGWERSELWPTVSVHEVVAPQNHQAPHPAIIAAIIAVVAIAALLLPGKNRRAIYRGPDRRRSHSQPKRERVPSGSLL